VSAVSIIHFPPFRLDRHHEQLWQEETVVPVRAKPFTILSYLVSNPERLVTAEELRKAVWPDTYVTEGLLWTYYLTTRVVKGRDVGV